MEALMKIDVVQVKRLREEKSWSQEHLASAAGLSTRTVQRVEAEGVGSNETRLALAAALAVPVAKLAPAVDTGLLVSPGHRRGRRWGLVGVGIGAVGAFLGIASGLLGGNLSGSEAGVAAALVCAGLGVSAALIGCFDYWMRTRAAAIHQRT